MSFFSDPVSALGNLAAAMRRSGRMSFVCWANVKLNPWFLIPKRAAEARLGTMEAGDPRAPGPTAFEDIAYVIALMKKAGLMDVGGKAVEVPLTPPDGARGAGGELVARVCAFDRREAQRALRIGGLFAAIPPDDRGRVQADAVRRAADRERFCHRIHAGIQCLVLQPAARIRLACRSARTRARGLRGPVLPAVVRRCADRDPIARSDAPDHRRRAPHPVDEPTL